MWEFLIMSTTLYCSPTGNDSTGDGSESTPYLTVNKCYDESSVGDTIYCMAGTHTWINESFSTGRIIQGAGSTLTFFDAGGPSATSTPTAKWNLYGDTEINDITFQNNGRGLSGRENSIFRGIGNGEYAVFNRCVFTDITLADDAGGSINASSGLIGNCSLSTYNGSFIINSCVFHSNLISQSGSFYGYMFAATGGGSRAELYVTSNNCTYHFNGADGVGANRLSMQCEVMTYNNCIIKNDTGGMVRYDEYDGASVLNTCDVYLMTDSTRGPGSNTFNNCITDDPEFVDGTNNDYRLRQGSPCLDTGKVI